MSVPDYGPVVVMRRLPINVEDPPKMTSHWLKDRTVDELFLLAERWDRLTPRGISVRRELERRGIGGA